MSQTTGAPRRGAVAVAVGICCGAVGVFVAWLPFLTFAGLLLGPAAIVSGLLGLSRGATRLRRRAWVSVALGMLTLVIMVAWPAFWLATANNGVQR